MSYAENSKVNLIKHDKPEINNSDTKYDSLKRMIIEAREKIDKAQVILFDWDGCIAIEDKPTESAIRFLLKLRKPFAILSNNSTKLPKDFAAILSTYGVQIDEDRIFLAGSETIKYAKEIGIKKVQIIGGIRMINFAKNIGLDIDNKDPQSIILLRDSMFNYKKLQDVVNKLSRGVPLIVANPDLTHPGSNGELIPETGALFSAINSCVSKTGFEYTVIGKPFSRLFDRVSYKFKVSMSDALMIGDNIDTDVKGACSIGANAILINTEFGISFSDF